MGSPPSFLDHQEPAQEPRGQQEAQGQAWAEAEESRESSVEGYLAPPPWPQGTGGQSDLLEPMEALNPLVASLGTDMVKRVGDLLG